MKYGVAVASPRAAIKSVYINTLSEKGQPQPLK